MFLNREYAYMHATKRALLCLCSFLNHEAQTPAYSQLAQSWYLSQMRAANAQESMCIAQSGKGLLLSNINFENSIHLRMCIK